MSFMSWIIQRLGNTSEFFYELYLDIRGWAYPFWLTAGWFYNLSSIFADLSWDFYYFNQWVSDAADKLEDILSWSSIQEYIKAWLYPIGDLTTIFKNFWGNVTSVITSWWSSAQGIVKGWINDAKALLLASINELGALVDILRAGWDSFKGKIPSIEAVLSWFSNAPGNILAVVIGWGALTSTQIKGLIDTAFTERDDFWEGWQEWGTQVGEFFSDPLTWLENKFADWFLGAQ